MQTKSKERPDKPKIPPFPTPRGYEQLISVFGDIKEHISLDGTLMSNWELEMLGLAKIPFAIPLSWSPLVKVMMIKCHKKLVPTFESIFKEIWLKGYRDTIKTYGGCFAWRPQRGSSSKISTHAWGIALDLNPDTNPLGEKGDMPIEIIDIFENHGFFWGGEWARPDPMHFQFAVDY